MPRRVLTVILALGAAAACEAIAPLDPVAPGGPVDASVDGALPGGDDAGSAKIFHVGPTRPYPNLSAVAPLLGPGDVVEVDGDTSYSDDVTFTLAGTAADPIRIKGLRLNGNRPHLVGNQNTVHLNAAHYVFEGFEVTSGNFACILHQADDVTLRDCVVHDCAKHGILGADVQSGSLVVDAVEVYGCPTAIDVATDQTRFPGAVFRLENSYLHAADLDGGVAEAGVSLNVVSRAERTELYSNWIEGAIDHEVSLVGTDGTPVLARMDADVVGNVFRKLVSFPAVRLGDDGTGPTKGRYRFVGNTFVLANATGAGLHVTGLIESLEIHDNVFARPSGAPSIVYLDGASWTSGAEVIAGQANWIQQGAAMVPTELQGTITGADPGFVDLATGKLWPAAGSPLVDHGVLPTQSPAGFPFPSPLASPLNVPPRGVPPTAAGPEARAAVGPMDIGAYELVP